MVYRSKEINKWQGLHCWRFVVFDSILPLKLNSSLGSPNYVPHIQKDIQVVSFTADTRCLGIIVVSKANYSKIKAQIKKEYYSNIQIQYFLIFEKN